MPIKMDNTVRSDVLVIGGALAGLWAAISAKEAGAERVVIVDKGKMGKSGQSPFAASIFLAFDPARDNYDVWLREIIENGEYLADQEWVKLFLNESLPIAHSYQEWTNGQAFELALDGSFLRRRARGHRQTSHMVQHAKPIMNALINKARSLGVTFVEHVMVTDLVTEGSKVVGAIGLSPRDGATYLFLSPTTIAAAAGVAFKTGMDAMRNLTGDLLVAALNAGAILSQMDNTVTNIGPPNFETHGMNLLMSMGKFLNGKGEEFLWKYDPELGNRSRLATMNKAFCFEVEAGRGPIYLDATGASPEDQALFRRALPDVIKLWDKADLSPFAQRLEWGPAPMGTNAGGGGIRINLACETNLEGLYATGDAANSPLHGRHTMGGINLSLAAVSGKIAGRNAAKFVKKNGSRKELSRVARNAAAEAFMKRVVPITRQRGISPHQAIPQVQGVILPYEYLIIRSKQSLEEARSKNKVLQEELARKLWARDSRELMTAIEVLNILQCAHVITEAALTREESRGLHHRIDFPMTDNVNWLKWILQQRDGDKIKIWTEPVPTPYVKPKEKYSNPPGVLKK